MAKAVNFVTDAEGQRISVLMPVERYESLMEDLSDLAAIADRRNESTVSHPDFVVELKTDGFLQA
ncbi:MAG: hypothetical protein AAF236_11475 [Verrucomicrobiota bacterium]